MQLSCTAKGAKPAVKLKLKIDYDNWIIPVDYNITENGFVYDSYITSGLVKLTANSKITCEASGQHSIAALNHTETIYSPICNVLEDGDEVRCSCKANPPVYWSSILVNGVSKQNNSLKFQRYIPAEFTCSGTNLIGSGSSTIFIGAKIKHLTKQLLVCLIPTICGVSILMVAAPCWFEKKRKGYTAVKNKIEGQEQNKIANIFTEIAEKVTCDWELFALHDLKLDQKNIISIVDSTDKYQEQVKAALEEWQEEIGDQSRKSVQFMIKEIVKKSDVCFCNGFKISTGDDIKVDSSCSSEYVHTTRGLSREEDKGYLTKDSVDFGFSESFGVLLQKICKSVGRVGLQNLQKYYRKNTKEETSQEFFKGLVKDNTLTETPDSVAELVKALHMCNLFYAEKLILLKFKADRKWLAN